MEYMDSVDCYQLADDIVGYLLKVTLMVVNEITCSIYRVPREKDKCQITALVYRKLMGGFNGLQPGVPKATK